MIGRISLELNGLYNNQQNQPQFNMSTSLATKKVHKSQCTTYRRTKISRSRFSYNPHAIHNYTAIPAQSVDKTAGEYRTRAGRSAVPFTDCKRISPDPDILTIPVQSTITKQSPHNRFTRRPGNIEQGPAGGPSRSPIAQGFHTDRNILIIPMQSAITQQSPCNRFT